VGSAHGKMQRLAMAHLKWLVIKDLAMIESASFWKDARSSEDNAVTVFLTKGLLE